MLALVLFLLGNSLVPGEALKGETTELSRWVAAGEWRQALSVARGIEHQLARRAPLEVLDAQVLAEPARGLGIYEPLPGNVVRQSELYLYAQVRNHGLREKAGKYELHLVSDLIVLDDEGHELARDERFGQSRFFAKARHRDTFVNIALRVTGLPSGSYRIRLVVHDRIDEKQASVEVPFRIP